MKIRFYIYKESGLPHIYKYGCGNMDWQENSLKNIGVEAEGDKDDETK